MKKIIAPIIVVVLISIYGLIQIVSSFVALQHYPGNGILFISIIAIFVILIIALLYNLYIRIKEIKEEDDDDLSKY